MAGSKRNKVEERDRFWRQHLLACRRSGLSYAEYCRRNELKESAFGYWRKRISADRRDRSGFVEVKISPTAENGIQVILRNQVRLIIGEDFDEQVLKRLVGALESI